MLTVMITCFNQENEIKDTILSILNQKTECDFKVLISDDMSTDNSFKVLKEMEKEYSNVKVIKTKEKKCVGNNRNNLINNLSTKYGCFVDGDDPQRDGFIESIYNAIKEEKHEVYKLENFCEVWSDGEVIKRCDPYYNFMFYVYSKNFLKGKSVNDALYIGEDVEFYYHYHKELNQNLGKINATYYLNRLDDNMSLTKNGDIKRRYELELSLYSKLLTYVDDDLLVDINKKKVDLINLAVLSDIDIIINDVNIKCLDKKYLISYILYKVLSSVGLLFIYKSILVKKIGYKI